MNAMTTSLQFSLGGAWLAEHTLQTLGAGLVVFDCESRLTQLDERAAQLLALEPGDANRFRLDDARWGARHLDGRTLDTQSDPITLALAVGTASVADVIGIATGDGSTRWIAVTALPLVGFDGETQAVLASLVEVTGVVRDRAAVDLAEQLGRSTFDHGALAMCVVDRDARLVEWNRSFAEIVDRADFELMASALDDWLVDGSTALDDLRSNPGAAVTRSFADGVVVSLRAWPSDGIRSGSMMVEMSPTSDVAA